MMITMYLHSKKDVISSQENHIAVEVGPPPTKEAPLSSWGVGWNHTALSFFQRKQGEAQLLINNRLYWRLDSRNCSPTFLIPKMSSFEFNLQDFQDTRSFFHKKEISKKWNYNGQKFSLLADISAQGGGVDLAVHGDAVKGFTHHPKIRTKNNQMDGWVLSLLWNWLPILRWHWWMEIEFLMQIEMKSKRFQS